MTGNGREGRGGVDRGLKFGGGTPPKPRLRISILSGVMFIPQVGRAVAVGPDPRVATESLEPSHAPEFHNFADCRDSVRKSPEEAESSPAAKPS